MLKKVTKSIAITGESIIDVTEGNAVKQVTTETYTCRISSDNPEDIRISRGTLGAESKRVYKEHREECHKDYAAFENMVYSIQDEMLAEANTATTNLEDRVTELEKQAVENV